jgi:anti-anti-sigma factor
MTSPKILVAENDGVHILKFVGDVRVTVSNSIDRFLADVLRSRNFRSVVIDLSETIGIDSTSLGLLAKIAIITQEKFGMVPTIISTNQNITRVLTSMGFDEVFVIVEKPIHSMAQLAELPIDTLSECDMRKKVLEAHRVLMNLSEGNQFKFRDLVNALEAEHKLAS